MAWYVPHRLRSRRALSGVMVAVLAVALAVLPATVAAASKAPKKPVSVPDCFHFPIHRMAELLRERGSFKFEGGIAKPDASDCTWITQPVPGRYRDILQISVAAIDFAQFKRSERTARQDATRSDALFGGVSDIRGATRAFYVSHLFQSSQLGQCKPGQMLEAFGPPTCFSEPDWSKVNADSYGIIKPRGPRASVAVAFDAERSIASPNGAIRLNAEILSGQIR